jgi:hypothetical protein
MASPKAKTIQQRFGFADQDLKKPMHDKIMYWMEKNLHDCLPDWIGCTDKWSEHRIAKLVDHIETLQAKRLDELEKQLSDTLQNDGSKEPAPVFLKNKKPWEGVKAERIKNIEACIESVKSWTQLPPLPDKPPISKITSRWEVPINTTGNYVSGNKYIVGFVDFSVRCNMPSLDLRGVGDSHLPDSWRPEWEVHFINRTFRFEVKTEIASLGEVIRQINMYREYDSDAQYYLVSPDGSHVDILNKERIGFIKYTP